MHHSHCRLAALYILALFASPIDFAGAIEVARLHCEHLRNPQGVDASQPRLSWTLRSSERGDHQTAYQVLVATSLENLSEGQADVWDSGKVASTDSVLVPYAGRPLRSHERLYWSVRVWDATDTPSDWSQTANWLMGILESDGWQAKWIGREAPEKVETLSDSRWIWYPEGTPTQSAPAAKRWFRKSFEVPEGRDIVSATFRITADDKVEINLNGRNLGSRSGHESTKELEVSARLHAGRNVIAVQAENRGSEPNPAGLVAWLQVTFAEGQPLLVVSDSTWLTSDTLEPEWEESNFDDSSWRPAADLGPVGIEPWGPVRHAESRRLPARYLRSDFTIDKPVRRAVVSYCGLGCSEFYVNGSKAGNQVLSPAMTEYPKRSYYVTRDVTDSIKQGVNALGAIVGNGRFYAPRSIVYAGMPTFGSPMLLAQMTIEHTDGSQTIVTSNNRWKLTTAGPIVANNEYDGEEYDARLELQDWSRPGYDDARWSLASNLNAPSEVIQASQIDSIRVTQVLEPAAITQPRPGVFIFDMGQNLVGWCRLQVEGPAGSTVRLRHAETLRPDGELYLANLRGAKATDTYTLKGEGVEVWEPRFTYHGFRFVELTGFPGEPTLASLKGCVVHDDLEPVGRFSCSDETINRVYQNARWGIRGNYRSVPTDCPQRDERQGWLGDRLETARSESYLFNVAAFYSKWLQDIRDTQLESGSIPDVVPAHWRIYNDDVVWPSSSILIPGILFDQYGDRRVLEEHYGSCVKWIDYMARFVRDDGLIPRDSYGDWCVPPESPRLIHSLDPARHTDTTLLASAFYFYDLQLMQQYAVLLGHETDAQRFKEAAALLRDAINANYYDAAASQYSNGTQTSSVLALAFNITPEGERDKLARSLATHVESRDRGALATGLVGAQFLCRTLTDIGRSDLAFGIASRESYPSWGYMVAQGATTIWELWNGNTADPAMNSGNHVMLIGDLITWLYEDLAGIAPHPTTPGFARLQMRPQPVTGLDWVKASLESPKGRIESNWRRHGDQLVWQVLIPPGATAELHLPATKLDIVRESGMPLEKAQGVNYIGQSEGRLVLDVKSGQYEFEIPQ